MYHPSSGIIQNTRGNKYKLLNHTFHYDTRKYSFTVRIVNIWNSLPNSVVDVDAVCLFKARVDKFWMHHGCTNSTQRVVTDAGVNTSLSVSLSH